MFEDEYPPRAQQSAVENQVDDPLAALQIIGRVGKNDVELLAATLQIKKNIGFDSVEIRDAELRGCLAYEAVVHGVDLYGRDAPGAARRKFVAYGARPGEEVEHVALLEVDYVAQDVEEVLLGEVRRRAGPQVAGRRDSPTPVFPAYDSHVVLLK